MSANNGVIRITLNDPDIDLEKFAFGNWLSGFVDGEGHFGLRIGHEYPNRVRPAAEFVIGLRADDVHILESIRDFLKCGVIYHKKQNGNKNPASRYVVWNPEQLIYNIVPHFKKFPMRAKKGKELETWTEGVMLLHEVSSRRVRGMGCGFGTRPKWSENELGQFRRLTTILSLMKEYVP